MLLPYLIFVVVVTFVVVFFKHRNPVAWGIGTFIVLFALGFIGQSFAGLYTDYAWFAQVGYGQVFTLNKLLPVELFVAGAVITFAFITVFDHWVMSLSPKAKYSYNTELAVGRYTGRVVASILFGLVLATQWQTILLYFNSKPFGASDPLLGADYSFYIFTLPFLEAIKSWLYWLFLSTAAIVGLTAAVRAYQINQETSRAESDAFIGRVMRPAAILGGIFFLVWAVEPWLDRYRLLVQGHSSVIKGAGFLDDHVYMPVLVILAIVSAVGALFTFIFRRWESLAVAYVIRLLVGVFGFALIPWVVNGVAVQPSQAEKETPYILNQIAGTRAGYNLAFTQQNFPYSPTLTSAELQNSQQTLNEIRTVDWRPLLDANTTLQEIRQYYSFVDVDVDRYNGRSLMPSVREIDSTRLPSNAQNWINNHLAYTHGYGYTVSEVNKVDAQGTPAYLVSDMPLRGDQSLVVAHPEVYYGEVNTPWVIVHTKTPEFGIPSQNGTEQVSYQGQAGVPISGLNRFWFAIRFNDLNMLLTDQITPESKILLHRQITERIKTIAPFLTLDSDPYPVIGPDRVYWMVDAYTGSDDFPYSEGGAYIRNSVKVVVDSYDGTINFYLVDPKDPIASSWGSIFPGIFQSADQMPDFLKAHLRYPEDLFKLQANQLALYHTDQANVYYDRQDQWEIPTENFEANKNPVSLDPRYLMMRLPDQQAPEFVLTEPFNAHSKQNMIALLAARMDAPHYGELVLYDYPADGSVKGPLQVDAQINQDTNISRDVTLWGSQGSQVLWGNMIVLPALGDTSGTNLYVKPLYIQAQNGKIPALKKVIIYQGDRIIYEDTFQQALAKLYGGQTTQTPAQSEVPQQQAQQPGQTSPVGGLPDISNLNKNQLTELIRQAASLLDTK